MELTREILKSALSYDPETGEFRWLRSKGTAKAGSIAGTGDSYGYTQIKLFGKRFLSHRLAWYFVHGSWPKQQIDHINRQKSDNRIINLRDVSNGDNQRNSDAPKNNTSGVAGVHWSKNTRKWLATGQMNSKSFYFGCHEDWWDAVCARKSFEAATTQREPQSLTAVARREN